jgi:hypothetical protein
MWFGLSLRILFPFPRRFAKSDSDSTFNMSRRRVRQRGTALLVLPVLVLMGKTALEWARDLSGASEEFPDRKRMDASPQRRWY